MNDPVDAVAAATHPDPYPWYQALRETSPFAHDPALNMCVAASAHAVHEVLTHPQAAVRPVDEPVPAGLIGTPAGDVFGRLVRMTDGCGQRELKRAVVLLLATLDLTAVRTVAHDLATRLLADPDHASDSTQIAFTLPVRTLDAVLGISDADLAGLEVYVHDFSRGIAPGATSAQMHAASLAVEHLQELVKPVMAERFGDVAADVAVANGIGFLFQSYDATAGLIGNAVLCLGRSEGVLEACLRDPGAIEQVVREVARWDPPVQNTRRWVTDDVVIAGQPLQAGEAILLLLAAANRDPELNADPDVFDPHRERAQNLGFGSGAHACPGEQIAVAIASAGVEALLAAGVDPAECARSFSYLPSANARIPVFQKNGT